MPPTYKVTYFDIRGRAEPIRILLKLVDAPFEDVRLSGEEFGKLKSSLPYGQLPILELEGGAILSQSYTILRYLARKHGLYGDTPLEDAKIDEMADALMDYSNSYWEHYGTPNKELRDEAVKNFVEVASPKYLAKFNQIVQQSGGPFLTGEKLTWVDIALWNSLDVYESLTKANLIGDHPALQEFFTAVKIIPRIQQWLDKRPVTPM